MRIELVDSHFVFRSGFDGKGNIRSFTSGRHFVLSRKFGKGGELGVRRHGSGSGM